VRFEDVDPSGLPERDVVELSAESVADARVRLLDALDARRGPTRLVGRGAWRTRVLRREGLSLESALHEGRTYACHGGGSLRLDVKLGAGDRGAYAGGVVETGALRGMVQVELEDPHTIDARFRISLLTDDGAGGEPFEDVTPSYLSRPVPRGVYRIPVDVPEGGGRYLVGVVTIDQADETVGHAWSSPIAVERPWL